MAYDPTVDSTASGTITTKNLVPAGVATAGSAVEIVCNGKGALTIQVTSAGTGVLSIQGTIDGTDWVTLSGAVQLTNATSGAQSATIPSATNGIYVMDCGGYLKIRVTGLAAVTGSGAISMIGSNATSAVALDQPIPTGANTIGAVTLPNGQTAHSAASSGSPVRVGGRVITTLDTTLVQGDASDLAVTSGQQLVIKNGASGENDWQYAAATTGILNTTTAVTIKAAGAASICNYITGFEIEWEALGAATEFAIRAGAAGTVIYRTKLSTAAGRKAISLMTPLRGTAATLLEVVTLTASVTGAVYFNAQGYQSF